MLVVLNLPLIGLWVKMLTIPYRVLFPAIVIFASIGCYPIDARGRDTDGQGNVSRSRRLPQRAGWFGGGG